jgi:hypothetical protein
MVRERPLRQRLITLVRLISDYYWTCSECYWKAPMGPTPMEALEQTNSLKSFRRLQS